MRATPRAAPSARVLNYTGHFAGSRVTASRSLFLINVKCSCETEARTERERVGEWEGEIALAAICGGDLVGHQEM